jgi:rRNA maturation RNase YbeY
MINFNYETDFTLVNEAQYEKWVSNIIESENKTEGDISYIFVDDAYLLNLNIEHLQHDTLTDIISFDYSLGNQISGDIFISVERVIDNAVDFKTEFDVELKRVMAHGILHYCGYNDKNEAEQNVMRSKEEDKIQMFHVEH